MPDRTTTVIFSDIHLTTAEPLDPARPLWRRYKRADLFVDDAIDRMIDDVLSQVDGHLEVVLNGDIFDFDAVTDLPAPHVRGADGRPLPVNLMERTRGLGASEEKSTFKIQRILDDHPRFVATLRKVALAGHDVVFVIGNHDLELHWPDVQDALRRHLDLGEADVHLRFCAWFYLSHGDTLIEHGNQYDSYCLCEDPLWPMIRLAPDDLRVRLPFGSYASRILVNGMGLINPHADNTWIMPFSGYVVFFWRHVLRVQPFLPLTWMWSSVVALWLSVRDGLEPSEVDVLSLEDRVEEVAASSNAHPRTVRGLHALRVHAAFFTPWRIARELWLDRLFLFAALILGSFQMLATLNAFVVISYWWWLALLLVLFPPFLFYARSVEPEARAVDNAVARRLELIAAVAGVNRVVLGHTHVERHVRVGPVELLNPGTWSPAFRDLACTEPEGRKCVVWIRPSEASPTRVATLEAWSDPGWVRIAELPEEPAPRPPRVRSLVALGRRRV
jgi:UDP-2,3-diacylglucosamine pyrophosphatase LpxH